MDHIWLAAPGPAIRIGSPADADGWRINPAARVWADERGLDATFWPALRADLEPQLTSARQGTVARWQLTWHATALGSVGDGWLVWLQSMRAAKVASPWRSGTDKLALVQDFLTIGVFEHDLHGAQGRWGARMYELFGFDPTRGVPSPEAVVDAVHAEDRERFRAGYRHAVRAAGRHALRFRIVHADASVHDLHALIDTRADESGVPSTMVGVVVDDSEGATRVRERAAILRRLELVADAAGLGIWSVDGEDGGVEWNEQMFRIYGIGPAQVPPTLAAWRDTLVHADDRDALTRARARAVESGAKGFETEFRIVRPDGSVRWVTSRSRHEQHDGRRLLIGIHLDVTELIEQRQRAEHAMRASQAKSAFLSRASHELRTPLNAVLGFAQLIEHDGQAAAPALQLERAGRIRSAGEHLLTLVDDVLDLAAIEAGRLAVEIVPVPIDDALVEVAQWLQPSARRQQVEIEVRRCGGWVHADARRLRQIIANLLSNAIKFNRAGGWVRLSARRRDDGDVPRWQISVRDTGRGVAPAHRAQLFEAFNRLGAEREGIAGVGLGLAIVRQLTELLQGSIEVWSTPGHGSEFRVTLPSAATGVRTAQGAGDRAPAAAPVHARSHLSMLYIEDSPVNVILVESMVARRPAVQLRCAVDGTSGVEQAVAHPPHVVLIDMQLPDFDGFEVLRRLRAVRALDATRMIVLSANSLNEDIARALAAGFDDYWTKPIDLNKFLARLDDLMAELGERSLPEATRSR